MIKRKLIEVALPLEVINRESAREKSIRHGHPSTLHLWWARRPLAACRAVLFAQLVDDPSAHPDEFPTEEAQETERQRLFGLIERLVVWENITDNALLDEAHAEIVKSCQGNPPAILDPFAGGGSIPLEAQRLGLEAHASDLNPVAVLINKALIEIPPKWAGHSPVFPDSAYERLDWPRATGLAEDVRRYGQWMRDQADERIGYLYPKATLSNGTKANVIAWIWARTVTCPNPACGIRMPLVRSWWLAKKKGKEAWIIPTVRNGEVDFAIGGPGTNGSPTKFDDGTVSRTGAMCVGCGTAVPLAYVRSEGKAGRMSAQLMAVVAEVNRRRLYLPPTPEHEEAAQLPVPDAVPDTELSTHPQYMGTPRYGLTRHADLFTTRQLIALTTFSDLVDEARARVRADSLEAGMTDGEPLESGGDGAKAYADSVAVYLGLGVGRATDINNALCRWENTKTQVRNLFTRQAISMMWDFAEAPPLADHAAGSYFVSLSNLAKALDRVPATNLAVADQGDAAALDYSSALVSTDPPYYDNVPYADLSDFFYVWLRRSLGPVLPSLLGTILTPKTHELVADHVRLGGRDNAQAFFEDGFVRVFANIRRDTPPDYPITVFYAFKQSDTDAGGTASTGWQTLLEGMIGAGWEITATWPMRTELGNRMRSLDSNALASSIVLACRPRPENAPALNRRQFLRALQAELPQALKNVQQGSIAPVDLAQAAIGPGMAVFSRHTRVFEADGSDMNVRTALALINQVLDEVLVEQEGDFDADTRFAIKWFTQYGWNEAPYGEADNLSRSTNTSVERLIRGGIFRAVAGKARLLGSEELSQGWDPTTDDVVSDWEVAIRLAAVLQSEGVDAAAPLLVAAGQRVDLDTVKELAYLMYSVCEKKGWSESALLFNALGTSWSDLVAAGQSTSTSRSDQGALAFDEE